MLLRLLINVHRNAVLQRKGMKLPHFTDSCWEILPKAIGQPQGMLIGYTIIYKNCWEMLKGYCIASGQLLNDIGKSLRKAQIPAGREGELPSSYRQKSGKVCSVSLKQCISIHIYSKNLTH
jgi:hypothetical protein